MKTCKVLVVQDDADLRGILVELLTEAGFPVEQAPNGHVALQLMQAGYKPDVILSDLVMPVMDGYELARELKRHESWSKIPLIVLTGTIPVANALEKIEALLQLPVELETLMSRVRDACARKSASA